MNRALNMESLDRIGLQCQTRETFEEIEKLDARFSACQHVLPVEDVALGNRWHMGMAGDIGVPDRGLQCGKKIGLTGLGEKDNLVRPACAHRIHKSASEAISDGGEKTHFPRGTDSGGILVYGDHFLALPLDV